MGVVDSHHHLWDPAGANYPLLSGPMHDRGWGDWSPLRRPYLVADFLSDARGQDLVKSVHVQANRDPADPVAETAWLDQLARDPQSQGFPQAVVAYANLAAPDAREVLDGHADFARVRGIRQVLNRHDDPRFTRAEHDWLSMPQWRDNLGLLVARGWSFDAQLYFPQMPALADLARRYPDLRIVIDHAGTPVDRDPAGLEGWRRGMRLLASCPNVSVKLSGYGMTDPTWTIDSLRPFVLEPIDWFGPDRAMFGSNFPVDRLMSGYARLWDAYRTIVADFSEPERHALMRGTAERFYRI